MIASAVAAHLRVCEPAACGLLFTTPAGAALNLANFRNRVWKPTVRALDGVPDQLRFHDLRHYADGWVMCPAVAFRLLGAAGLVLQSA